MRRTLYLFGAGFGVGTFIGQAVLSNWFTSIVGLVLLTVSVVGLADNQK